MSQLFEKKKPVHTQLGGGVGDEGSGQILSQWSEQSLFVPEASERNQIVKVYTGIYRSL